LYKIKELKNEIYDKDNGFWYKRDVDYYLPEYYIGKGLSLEEATRLKEQRIKEDTENVILGKYGRTGLIILKLTSEAYMPNYWWIEH